MNTSRISDGCRLCGIPSGRPALGCDAPVMSVGGYFGLASIGGFIPGWSLLCPNDHRHNLAEAYLNPELHRAVSTLVDAVTAEFGEAAIFEHGSLCDGSLTACGTSHAHLHVVPFADDLADIATADRDTSLDWIPTRLFDVAATAAGHEYLFVANRYKGPETNGYLARLGEPRSQFFRRLLASRLGVPHLADYRIAPLEAVTLETAGRVRASVKRLERRAA